MWAFNKLLEAHFLLKPYNKEIYRASIRSGRGTGRQETHIYAGRFLLFLQKYYIFVVESEICSRHEGCHNKMGGCFV